MTRQFYNAPDALWMLRNHGMTFDLVSASEGRGEVSGTDSTENALRYWFGKGVDCKAYPDAAGIALLTPRKGDLLQYQTGGDAFVVPGDDPTSYPGFNIIQRDGKPFIMPKYEEIDHIIPQRGE